MRIAFGVRLTAYLHDGIKYLVEKTGMSQNSIINNAINEYLEKHLSKEEMAIITENSVEYLQYKDEFEWGIYFNNVMNEEQQKTWMELKSKSYDIFEKKGFHPTCEWVEKQEEFKKLNDYEKKQLIAWLRWVAYKKEEGKSDKKTE